MNIRECVERAGWNIQDEGLDYNINAGGCGVFAAALGYELQKRNIPVRILMATPYKDQDIDIEYARNNRARTMEEWNDHAGARLNGHVFVEFQWDGTTWYADASEVYEEDGSIPTFKDLKMVDGEFTVRELCHMVREADGWNWCFDWNDRHRVWRAVRNAFRC